MEILRFSDVDQKTWSQWQPFVDTAVVPLTGLDGTETPWEMRQRLEILRDLLDITEQPFKGRVLVLPAVQYAFSEYQLKSMAKNLRHQGYHFIITVAAWRRPASPNYDDKKYIDFEIFYNQDTSEHEQQQVIRLGIERIWQAK